MYASVSWGPAARSFRTMMRTLRPPRTQAAYENVLDQRSIIVTERRGHFVLRDCAKAARGASMDPYWHRGLACCRIAHRLSNSAKHVHVMGVEIRGHLELSRGWRGSRPHRRLMWQDQGFRLEVREPSRPTDRD